MTTVISILLLPKIIFVAQTVAQVAAGGAQIGVSGG
jgi:hypothetical protein